MENSVKEDKTMEYSVEEEKAIKEIKNDLDKDIALIQRASKKQAYEAMYKAVVRLAKLGLEEAEITDILEEYYE